MDQDPLLALPWKPTGKKTKKKEPAHPKLFKEFSDRGTEVIFQAPGLTRVSAQKPPVASHHL